MKITLHIMAIALIFFQSCGPMKSGQSTISSSYPFGLDKAYEVAEDAPNLRSLLVSYQDTLISEAYFDTYRSDSLDHGRSVTKSIMATLIGIAIDQGIIPGLDTSIGEYFGETAKGKEQIQIKHLLNMTSGIQWQEDAEFSEFNQWVTSSSPYLYTLNKPLAHTPATIWNYNSGAIHLLSVILTKASGMNTLDFAKKYLFDPLGIEKVRWERLSDGYYNGGAGLELKPRDMIKIGQLYAHHGVWKGKRIVSEAYIQAATTPHQPKGTHPKEAEGFGYGYGWFLVKAQGVKGYMALGYAGQMIAVAPEINMVMVATHNWRGVRGKQIGEQSRMASSTLSKLVMEGILNGRD